MLNDLHESKASCLDNLKRNETSGNSLEPIIQSLKEVECQLKRDNVDFILKTVDGDRAKWKEIQIECSTMLTKVQSLEDQLKEMLLGDERIGFRPSASDTPIADICGRLAIRSIDSFIISSFKMENDLVELCKLNGLKFELLYRASRDGFKASSFHAKCDNKARTLAIIRSLRGCIFGAYTTVDWDSTSGFKADPDAFLFSLVNLETSPLVIPIKDGDNHAFICKADRGLIFGLGNDLKICDNSNISNESFSYLGKSYDLKLFEYGSIKAQSFLAGSCHFLTSEI